ncbi:hypothetical protein BDN71DRAFT_1530069, partial [Pleurotus eryngii]
EPWTSVNAPNEFVDDNPEANRGKNSDQDSITTNHQLPVVPLLKRQKLDVSYRKRCAEEKEAKWNKLKQRLTNITKLLTSKKTEFSSGDQGLQACRARAIQSHLHLIINKCYRFIEASEKAAETHGFAAKWGGRQLCGWTREWVLKLMLPVSYHGRHVKVYSLLSDPAIAAELRAYMRSNKWSMDPQKLAQFSEQKMVPAAAKEYLEHLIDNEMPRGLKQYMELELFPQIHLKVGRGISVSTVRSWLHAEGFKYTTHKKGLYFDGHEQPDYPLRKKGAGRGIHQSDILCSTFGWIEEASQTLEYGKNYDGYWTEELFVKQVSLFPSSLQTKIIPALEKQFSMGFQFLIIVDNSQGHSAYAEDALLVSRMNIKPGGKQAHMCDGWYHIDMVKVTQSMVYASDHQGSPHRAWSLSSKLEGQFHCELNFIEYFWGMVKKYLCDNCDYTFKTLKENMPKAM